MSQNEPGLDINTGFPCISRNCFGFDLVFIRLPVHRQKLLRYSSLESSPFYTIPANFKMRNEAYPSLYE